MVINPSGVVLLSRRVDNDETELLELIATVVDLGDGDLIHPPLDGQRASAG